MSGPTSAATSFMESRLSLLRMHRDHEPRLNGRCRANVLDCGSPLPLLRPRAGCESARGLAQSKISRCDGRFMERASLTSVALCSLPLCLFLAGASALFAESVLLTGAIVHTVSGPTLAPCQVLIQAGKIVSVDKILPANADKIVKLDGQHLYPGLIAATTSLGLIEIDAVRATRDTTEVGEYTPDVESWAAVNPDSELIPVASANGITHFLPVPGRAIVAGQSGLLAPQGRTTP